MRNARMKIVSREQVEDVVYDIFSLMTPHKISTEATLRRALTVCRDYLQNHVDFEVELSVMCVTEGTHCTYYISEK